MSDANNHIENTLIPRLKRGESQAFDEIYHLYSRRIYRFAYSFLKTKQDSEGIVQEVFLRVWKNRKNIDEYYSLKAFLFTISYHVIIDKIRERTKDKKYRDFLRENTITLNSETDMKIDYTELYEMYTNTIELLPERRRIIYKMHQNKGFTYQEIANKLNISTKTVENQMISALKFIREKLGPETLTVVLFSFLVI